jgi:translocation and assembly module TamA
MILILTLKDRLRFIISTDPYILMENILKNHLIILFFIILSSSILLIDRARGETAFEAVIEGLSQEPRKNVELALLPPEGMTRDGQIDELLLALFEKEAPEKIRKALEPFGYYHPRIDISTQKTPDWVRFSARIDPGEPVRVSRVELQITGPGAGEETLLKQIRGFPLRQGEVLRQDQYEEYKRNLKSAALEAGYLEADFPVHQILLSLNENEASIELTLETGPLYFFGAVSFIPPLTFPEPFLRRYLGVQSGEIFSLQKVNTARLNFLGSELFQEVSIEADPLEARDHRVPVRVRLTSSKPKRLRFGLGYDTDKGPGLIGRYRDLNLFGKGYELISEGQFSERLQGLAWDLTLPGSGNLEQKTRIKMGAKRENIDSYTTRSYFSEYERLFPFGQGRMGTGYLRLLGEDFEVGTQEGYSTLLIPGVRFWDRRFDDPARPRQGFRYLLETRGGAPFLGASGYFLQWLAQTDYLIPLGKGFSLLLRGQAGNTLQTESLKSLPPTLRFFAGGYQSLRGYDYQSLGPKDESGRVMGGRNLLIGSLEIEKALTETWGMAAFYDLGNAFNEFSDIGWRHSAGLGLRLYTPLGPIRLDLAHPLGVDTFQLRVHFSFGFGL